MVKNLLCKIKSIPACVSAYIAPHPILTRVILSVWNAFSTSWATGIKVPIDLQMLGIPLMYTVDTRAVVAHFQHINSIPTWVVGLFTFCINVIIAFGNWQKDHPAHQCESCAPKESTNGN